MDDRKEVCPASLLLHDIVTIAPSSYDPLRNIAGSIMPLWTQDSTVSVWFFWITVACSLGANTITITLPHSSIISSELVDIKHTTVHGLKYCDAPSYPSLVHSASKWRRRLYFILSPGCSLRAWKCGLFRSSHERRRDPSGFSSGVAFKWNALCLPSRVDGDYMQSGL